MTTSTPIIPVYRGLTVAGNVLVRYISDRDEFGEVYHTCVVDSTLDEEVHFAYELLSGRTLS